MDAAVMFFIVGAVARLMRSDLRIPAPLYEALSIYLLLAIGLKGGAELAKQDPLAILPKALAVVALGALIPLLAYPVLRAIGRFSRSDAGAIAGHYGSVSVVTYAVGVNFLVQQAMPHESYMPLLLVLLEVPGIVVGVLLARSGGSVAWSKLLHEVLLGKSVVLLVGGLLVGWAAGPKGIEPLTPFFFQLFKGVLCLFLLEMGLVAASHFGDLRKTGFFLIGFGVGMPLVAAGLGILLGTVIGLSPGGTVLLATLAGSASYIAAPAAMRIAVPEANPAISITAALAITFPFNIVVGIPLYFQLTQLLRS
ncbi:sodium-dependent bicarbonate transport family permease [Accumulibacter sp.]|uniref:sodium-dependent bicarbonate transport family permease n=1 Tax=Accumulibacter sp. TaxID=2053492 RepID=UPI0025F8B60C|nr:sodium-dependent bicarbonate transport family permease [Accumulibacter sp.]MCM8596979.1 sodium-dependent bicarbonate transport family permease [Accumulibacter sp.]MCM8624473.1 sodium-dependent bicarbonate transport family permease [Accumulibacter sp.]MDS4051128.1 sodium-dependent bicarbonate transport family permease [Accumulibacter sp.]